MTRGAYTSASGLIAEFQRMEITANNLANINTPAFKKDIPVFNDYLKVSISPMAAIQKGITSNESYSPDLDKAIQESTNRMTRIVRTEINWEAGHLKKVKNPNELGLEGPGFFKVMTPNGVQYTRNGLVMLDKKRRMIDSRGNFYLGTKNKKITLPISASGATFRAVSDGNISINGIPVGKMQIIDFKETDALIKKGEGYYVLQNQNFSLKTDPRERKNVSGTKIMQGYREDSNVNVVKEMVNMISSIRAFEGYQKMVQSSMTDTTQKVINSTGRPRG